jgi:choline-sulfatase
MAGNRPNVLWICTDQQRYDTLGSYGNEFVETPNIDGLAKRGTRFDRCYSQSPVCTPSRASFLTGRYPRTTRCRQNGQNIPADETLVTKRFSDAGYTCGLSGKLHLSPCHPDDPDNPMKERRIDDGYDEFHWSHDSEEYWPTSEYHHWLREKGVEFEQKPFEGSQHVLMSVAPEHHQTTFCAQKAINFIEANADRDRPWLFSVNIFDPHPAFDPPESYLRRYLDDLEDIPLPDYEPDELDDKPVYQRKDHRGALFADDDREGLFDFTAMDDREHRLIRAAYWAMIDLIDDQVGRMLDALDRTSQRQNTIVVFMSDHGEMLGDHGIYLKGPYFYEQAVRVPLVVSWPDVVESNVESDALVELVDLAPTLLDAADIEHHAGMQGESFWPILAGNADSDSHRRDVYSEFYNAKPGHTDPELPFGTMLRTEQYKLVLMHRLDGGELYDLAEDPKETENRWNDPKYQSTKLELLERLTGRMAETVDPLPERRAKW